MIRSQTAISAVSYSIRHRCKITPLCVTNWNTSGHRTEVDLVGHLSMPMGPIVATTEMTFPSPSKRDRCARSVCRDTEWLWGNGTKESMDLCVAYRALSEASRTSEIVIRRNERLLPHMRWRGSVLRRKFGPELK